MTEKELDKLEKNTAKKMAILALASNRSSNNGTEYEIELEKAFEESKTWKSY